MSEEKMTAEEIAQTYRQLTEKCCYSTILSGKQVEVVTKEEALEHLHLMQKDYESKLQ